MTLPKRLRLVRRGDEIALPYYGVTADVDEWRAFRDELERLLETPALVGEAAGPEVGQRGTGV